MRTPRASRLAFFAKPGSAEKWPGVQSPEVLSPPRMSCRPTLRSKSCLSCPGKPARAGARTTRRPARQPGTSSRQVWSDAAGRASLRAWHSAFSFDHRPLRKSLDDAALCPYSSTIPLMKTKIFFPIFCLAVSSLAVEPPHPGFRAVDIDTKIEIGYGVTVADVDGDGKPDILLADKKQFVWYKNPTWEKFVLAENLTKEDNVCIAAADIDGDGRCEIAVGAGWNPGDTVNSGALFYLVPPKERTRKWDPVVLHHEPTVHRMRWVKNWQNEYELVVAPLHGRGNKNGQGDGEIGRASCRERV